MAKIKPMVISGPMDAKHVGGVNVMSGIQQSGIDSYFKNTTLEPDETPSHTFVATGKIEVPKRSDTITNTIRRPSLSIKRSLSRLRRSSISQIHDLDRKIEPEHQNETSISRTESTKTHRSLRMQSSISRLRQRVGLDRDLHSNSSPPKVVNPELEITPHPLRKDSPPLRAQQAISRFTSRSASTTPEPKPTMASHMMQRQTSIVQRQPSFIQGRHAPTSSAHIPAATRVQPPTRPKRVDSGTAIDLKELPTNERPLGFQAILAVQSFEDRMKHYERARDYWAHAEHGLAEWTHAAVAPR
ncbi:hypothetical protein CC86DRAFT_252051, partial [Ophiobolus disseminans]